MKRWGDTMRVDLASAIPLEAPFSLYIEPTNSCNFRCGVCPISLDNYAQRAGYKEEMSHAVWSRIIASLKEFATPLRVIRFYTLGEPLLKCASWLQYVP